MPWSVKWPALYRNDGNVGYDATPFDTTLFDTTPFDTTSLALVAQNAASARQRPVRERPVRGRLILSGARTADTFGGVAPGAFKRCAR